jgi:hypothetical protein
MAPSSSPIAAWIVVLWMGCGSESTGTTTTTTGGAGSDASGGASASGGSSASGGASMDGSSTVHADASACPTEPPQGSCTTTQQSLVCEYVTADGCPLSLGCGYVESASPIWYTSSIPLLSGTCPKVGAICTYSFLYFQQTRYDEYQCSAGMTWQQHLCPAIAPNTGDPCSRAMTGYLLQCSYDEPCMGGTLQRTVAYCSNYAAADAGSSFAVSKTMRACSN